MHNKYNLIQLNALNRIQVLLAETCHHSCVFSTNTISASYHASAFSDFAFLVNDISCSATGSDLQKIFEK